MVTPDGCPVEAYRALPAEPELSFLAGYARGPRTILDLGCGTGRIAEPLARQGHRVVGVDESADMLAALQRATPVCAAIADLDLGERFDIVLLLSYLINTADPNARTALLASCSRHVAASGIFIAQRHDPDQRILAGEAQFGPVHISVTDVNDERWPVVRATTEYELDGQRWRQPWTAQVLDDTETTSALRGADLEPLKIDKKWVIARPETNRSRS